MSKIKCYSLSPLIEITEKSIIINHGRDKVSKEVSYAIAELWETKGGSEGKGGYVLNIV
ncbi:MAG: hypothetical protein ACQEWT_00120 [Bacillota bacterium]